MSGYRVAIEQTTQVIQRRAWCFRNQIIAVVLVSVGSVAWAVVAGSTWPLLGMFLLIPLCGVFLMADNRILDQWRTEILSMWTRRDLDITAFSDAIGSNLALPRETAEGMLATLPFAEDLIAEQRMATPTRRAVAAAVLARYGWRSEAMAIKVFACAVAGVGLVVALATSRREALLTLVGLVILPVVAMWIRGRRLAESRRQEAECRRQPGFSEPDYIRLLGRLT